MTMKAAWRREIDRKPPGTALDDHLRYMAELWGRTTQKHVAAGNAPLAGMTARLAARYAAKIGVTQ